MELGGYMPKINKVDYSSLSAMKRLPEKIVCPKCGKEKPLEKYILTYNEKNKKDYIPYCNTCLGDMTINQQGEFDKVKLFQLCKEINKPFSTRMFNWVYKLNKTKKGAITEKEKVAKYFSLVDDERSGLRGKGFEDGEIQIPELEETIPQESETDNNSITEETDKSVENSEEKKEEGKQTKKKSSKIEVDYDLWGMGWTMAEYKQLADLYNAYLNNYPLRTEMHKRALVKICKLQLRYDTAIANNDTTDAKYWGDLLSKAQTEAKFNPSQLSQADLSDGMSSFSQLSAMVEKAIDIIPLLNHLVEEPKDRVDYILWEHINYDRHMLGKPLIEYKEIYKFLKDRQASLEKRYKFMKLDPESDFDTNDIDTV